MVASIYTTVVIALERYVAVSRPISTYVTAAAGGDEGRVAAWCKVLKYVGPAVLLSAAVNVPTFFELTFLCKKGAESGELFLECFQQPNCPNLDLERGKAGIRL